MKPLRVLHIVASSHGGGAEALRCLVKGLDPREFASVVIMPDDGGQVGASDFAALATPLVRFRLERGFRLAEFLRLRRFVRRGRFDLVHVHGARAALWGRLAAAGAHRPGLVFSVHGLSLLHYGRVRRGLQRALERLLGPLTDATLCVSERERADVLRLKIAPQRKAITVLNGIDHERLLCPAPDRAAARARWQLPAAAPTLVMLCRLDEPRDFDTLLAGMRDLRREWPAVQLLIAGSGPLRPRIEALIERHGLRANVRLLGLVHDVGALLAAADVALLITAGFEGLPLAALEAMAAGLPTILSDVGGNREALVPGETGLLVPPRDVPAFVQAVRELLADPARARRMGQAGGARARQFFDHRIMAARVADVYRAVLGARGAARGR